MITEYGRLVLDAATAATSLSINGRSASLEIGSAGSLTLTTALDVGAETVILDGSAVQLTDTAGIMLEGGRLTGSGMIAPGMAVTGYGTVGIAIDNQTGTAAGGTLEFSQSVNSFGTFEIANVTNSVLKFDAAVTGSPTILFEGGGAGVGVLDLTAINLSQFNGVLSNIGTGEGILVNGAASVTLSPDGQTLTVYNSSNIELGTLALDRPYTGDYFHIINGNEIVICFMPGTFIRTPAGEQAVESLAIGDLVLTAEGEAQPILWIGRQTVSRVFADPLRVLPIRITAGALDENLPVRDLLVSPDHALLVGDVLIQAGALVNGTSIRREENVPKVYTYYHVELADHALILAEGVPAETFVDTVDRLAFDNWAEHLALYPAGREIAELPLPRARSHRQVPMALRRHLAGRAAVVAA